MLKSYAITAIFGILCITVIIWISIPTLVDKSEDRAGNVTFPISEITIVSKADKAVKASYKVEVASNYIQRTVGLKHRKSLAADSAMLFLFGIEKKVAMWMKDTYIPLDMIFISRKGEIREIVTDTVPGSEVGITSSEPAYAVLEVNAGDAKYHQLKVGDKVIHASFR